MSKKLCIVIPVYNEELNILPIKTALEKIFQSLPQYNYEILFINDGSSDQSLHYIMQEADRSDNISYLSFSRNFGKDNAILAGIRHAKADALITMDADLQHPPDMIPAMIDLWEQGNEVVYAYRENKNEHAGLLNRITSRMFYKIINLLSDIEMEDGLSDFRLLDKKVIHSLNSLHEDHPFFRGLIKWVGFKQTGIPYTPFPRANGETKYNNKALVRLALQGITSFSVKPLFIAIYLGLTFSMLSLLYIPYVIYSLYFHLAISGWTSIIVTIAFFGGLQLMILGILGIYIGKIFMQGKERPHFIINENNRGL